MYDALDRIDAEKVVNYILLNTAPLVEFHFLPIPPWRASSSFEMCAMCGREVGGIGASSLTASYGSARDKMTTEALQATSGEKWTRGMHFARLSLEHVVAGVCLLGRNYVFR